MQITDVRLRKVNSEKRMKAVASVTFDSSFCITSSLAILLKIVSYHFNEKMANSFSPKSEKEHKICPNN